MQHVHESHEVTIEEAVRRVFKPKFFEKLTCKNYFTCIDATISAAARVADLAHRQQIVSRWRPLIMLLLPMGGASDGNHLEIMHQVSSHQVTF
jgi:hypothetical protein